MNPGRLRHLVQFQTPATVPDGDGGYVDTWVDLDPPWPVEIRPATVRDLERQTAGTVVAAATHVIAGRYNPAVTIDAKMLFDGREFRITGIANLEERGIEMRLFAIETI